MHPKNLATVMSPNIMYRKIQENEAILHASQEMVLATKIVTLLIQNVEFFFAVTDKEAASLGKSKRQI